MSPATQRHLRLVVAGIALVGLGVATFSYFDQATILEGTVKGIVTDRPRDGHGVVQCRVRLADGLILQQQCSENLTVGTRVVVDRFRRPLSGRFAHSAPRRD